MSESTYAPCPACQRHVRTTETSCPFCDRAFPGALAGKARPILSVRLSRAALYALGTGTLSLAAACGGATIEGSSSPRDGGEVDASGSVDAGSDASFTALDAGGVDAGTEDSGINFCCPPYGSPGVTDEDAGASPAPSDAGFPDVFIAPPYGLPPTPPKPDGD